MEDSDLCSSDAFQLVLSTCHRLIDLRFCQSKLCLSRDYYLGRLPLSCCSSTLTKLDIRLDSFADCLLLLDGRFDCLSTFVLSMDEIIPVLTSVDYMVSEIHRFRIILNVLCCVESTAVSEIFLAYLSPLHLSL